MNVLPIFLCGNVVWWAARAAKKRRNPADFGAHFGVAYRDALILVDEHGADPADVKHLLKVATLETPS